jgi:hypothetical protein
MSTISGQIKQHLAQPDLDASRRKALNYLNDNHTFSQSTLELEDTFRSLRHERDSLRVSVRKNAHFPVYYLTTFRSSDGRFKCEHRKTEI